MKSYKDHEPVVIDQFNGYWNRGDKENCPLDHFTHINNVKFIGENCFRSRYGVGISQNVAVPLSNVKRIYNYPTPSGNTKIVLTVDPATLIGTIYHVVSPTLVYGPILTIQGMEDFAFLPYAGRGYISPFATLRAYTSNPQSPMLASLVAGAGIEAGIHKYAFTFVTAVGETSTSELTTITTVAQLTAPVIAPSIMNSFVASGNTLVNGGTYKWLFTYSRDGVSETTIGPESTPLVNDNSKIIGLFRPVGLPADVTHIGVYRNTNGGATFRRVQAALYEAAQVPLSPGVLDVSAPSDTDILAFPLAPVANGTQKQRVTLNNILIGPTGTTARKIYRTVAGGSQLKLLTTLANNTVVTFADTAADGTLGANAPATNSAVITDSFTVEKGLDNEFLYVYMGDGVVARKAAGSPLTGTLTIAHGITGHTDAGFHLFAFVAETTSGYLTAPGTITGFTTVATNSVSFGTVPSGSSSIAKRHLVATKKITGYTGNTTGYQFYFVPDAIIENNTDAFLNNISFFDQDLLDDASYLIDNYAEIPAGAVLSLYRDRLVLAATFDDISIGLVSASSEPEAISQIDGIIVVPPDGYAITNAQELRDILYVTKPSRTVSFNDNGDVPSSWKPVTIDDALGTSVHGIGTVSTAGSQSVDFLIIATYQGISLFNGRYIVPELSLKVESFWRNQNRDLFKNIQIMNESIGKELYIVLPTKALLVGNYANGFDPKKIRWSTWTFQMGINTIAITDIDELVLGSDIF